MNDAGYIMSFDNTSGLDPQVVAKLNNNFWRLINMFHDSEIVAVSGTYFPSPRTNETLFYKTDTGDLYIWALKNESTNEWGWLEIEINLLTAHNRDPRNNDRPGRTEVFWYNYLTGDIFTWYKVNSNTWKWLKLDIGYIHVDSTTPSRSVYQRVNEVLWVNKGNVSMTDSPITDDRLWVWMNVNGTDKWIPLVEWYIDAVAYFFANDPLAVLTILQNFPKDYWLACDGFVAAVNSLT